MFVESFVSLKFVSINKKVTSEKLKKRFSLCKKLIIIFELGLVISIILIILIISGFLPLSLIFGSIIFYLSFAVIITELILQLVVMCKNFRNDTLLFKKSSIIICISMLLIIDLLIMSSIIMTGRIIKPIDEFLEINIVCSIIGLIFLSVYLILNRKIITTKKLLFKSLCSTILISIIMFIICVFSITPSFEYLFLDNEIREMPQVSGSSSDTMTFSLYAKRYLEISDVELTSNSSYTICTGVVRNAGMYRVRYLKVKCEFKDSNGDVIDTDWEYLISSGSFEPKESMIFVISVKNNAKISKCDVSLFQ